jgi:hypothetical protein
MILSCSQCHVRITKNVEELRDRSTISETDGEPYLPAGFFLVCQPEDDVIRDSGDYVLNLTDMQNTKRHSDRSRLNGCCDLDGCDGLNILCTNGHEIGSEHSDCWMPHYIALSPSLVTQSNATGNA